MSNVLDVAKRYFELSNDSDMDAIEALMSDSTTYSSKMGVFLGKNQIMTMQRAFHSSFQYLHWNVLSADEIRPGVVLFDFVFSGLREDGQSILTPGEEYVIVMGEKLQHIEVRTTDDTTDHTTDPVVKVNG